jgi:hypothetical protein
LLARLERTISAISFQNVELKSFFGKDRTLLFYGGAEIVCLELEKSNGIWYEK